MINENSELILELWARIKSHIPPKERLEVADILIIVFDEFGKVDDADGGHNKFRLIYAPSRRVILMLDRGATTVQFYLTVEPLSNPNVWLLEKWMKVEAYTHLTKEEWNADPSSFARKPLRLSVAPSSRVGSMMAATSPSSSIPLSVRVKAPRPLTKACNSTSLARLPSTEATDSARQSAARNHAVSPGLMILKPRACSFSMIAATGS